MADLASNPIYKRIILGSKGPSPLICWLIGVGIALAGSVLLLAGGRSGLFGAYAVIFLIIAALFQPLYLCAAIVLSAQMVARHVSNEDFALVRISGLTDKQIVHGYFNGLRYRFRAWIAVGMGILAATLVPALISVGANYSYQIASSVILIFLGVLFTLAAYYFTLWPLALIAGVWVALRSPRSALPLAAGLVLILVIYMCFAGYATGLTASSVDSTLGPFAACLAYTVFAVVLPVAAIVELRRQCIHLIGQR